MKATPLHLEEVLLLEVETHEDNRGMFYRNFSQRDLDTIGITKPFVEERLYRISKAETLYGIHFQNKPKPQAKLLYCTKGWGLDFAIDLRKDSETYKQWVCVELSEDDQKQIYVPAGFGHAFLAMADDTRLVFRIDEYFDPDLSRSISYKDEEIGLKIDLDNPILSTQDAQAPFLRDSDCNL
jgi:dTDP-4-dehydrorhamnose 3,5-epimerase